MTGTKAQSSTLIAAGIIGFSLALLIAPKSGKESRQKIKDEVSKVRAKTHKKADESQEQLEEELQNAQAKVLDIQEKIKNSANDNGRSSLLARWTEE